MSFRPTLKTGDAGSAKAFSALGSSNALTASARNPVNSGAGKGPLAALPVRTSGGTALNGPPRIEVPTFSFAGPSEPSSPVTPTSPEGFSPDSKVPKKAAELARAWQAGMQTRRHFEVKRLAPGIIATRIQGGPDHFARVGMPGLAHNKTAELHITAVDPHRYKAHIVGGGQVNTRKSFLEPDNTVRLLNTAMPPKGGVLVLANGGYFNAGQNASKNHPVHAVIGEMKSLTPGSGSYIKPPEAYRQHYKSIDLGRTSMMSAPQLSEAGVSSFPASKLNQPDYQFSPEKNQPGKLSHASDPNPRGLVSFPANLGRGANSLPGSAPDRRDTSRQDAVRFVAITSSIRGEKGTGATLPVAADVAARVDRMNMHPGYSINRDGGNSVYQSVQRVGEGFLQEVRSQGTKSRSNSGESVSLIAMTSKV